MRARPPERGRLKLWTARLRRGGAQPLAIGQSIRDIVMKSIDQVSDQHRLALGRFIVGCARVKSSTLWRAHFARCAQQGGFSPYVASEDEQHLRELLKRHGQGLIVGLNTAQIMRAANEVAKEWDLSPLVLELANAPPDAPTNAVTA